MVDISIVCFVLFCFVSNRFELELFDHLCGDTLVQVVENKIREHIESISLDNYEESFIKPFEAVSHSDNLAIASILHTFFS